MGNRQREIYDSRDLGVDRLQELAELLMAVLAMEPGDDLPSGVIQGGEQLVLAMNGTDGNRRTTEPREE